MNIHFTYLQTALFISYFQLVVLSLFFFSRRRLNAAVMILFAAAILIYCFSALLDPFLNIWDERFHALVAKNMVTHPFKPMLYTDPVMIFEYNNWDRYHVWLHKQPLFLWQIALSFKLFGVSEFCLRIPNIIMASLMVFVVFRTGQLLVNERTGYLAALLMSSSWIIIELVSGRQEMEHNDLSFLFYVSCSIWVWLEWRNRASWKWIILVGVFSGCAVLCKWLPGLIVFGAWGLTILLERKWRNIPPLLLAFLVCCILFFPWQIYIFAAFPQEAARSYEFNLMHFTMPVDGHEGPWWYHFEKLSYLYGFLAPWVIIPAVLALIFRAKNRIEALAFTVMLLTVYTFFSISATKAPCYTMMVSMITFIGFGSLLNYVLEKTGRWKYHAVLAGLTLLVLLWLNIRPQQISDEHSLVVKGNRHSEMLFANRELFTHLKLPENAVLLNITGRHFIEAMFYTGRPAYPGLPSNEVYEDLLRKERKPYIFIHPDSNYIPVAERFPGAILLRENVQGYY